MIKQTALVLVLMLGALLLAEQGLRQYLPAPDRAGVISHPLFGRIRRPGFSIEKGPPEKRWVFRINELGLRGPAMSLQKPAGTYRIIFVGASVVESQHLPEEETFPFLVERELNERLGGVPQVEVGVLARPGAGSEVVLALIANRALELSPDLIIAQSAGDWLRPLHPDYEPTLVYLASESSHKKNIRNALLDTRLVRLMTQLQRARNSDSLASTRAARRSLPFRDPPDSQFERGLGRYHRNLHRSGVLCQDASVAFALLTKAWLYKADQPPEEDAALWMSYRNDNVRAGGWNVSPAVASRWADRYNDVQREVAREDDLILVDLARTIPRTLVNLRDDVHLTAAGNVAVAAEIVSELLRDGTLPRAKRAD